MLGQDQSRGDCGQNLHKGEFGAAFLIVSLTDISLPPGWERRRLLEALSLPWAPWEPCCRPLPTATLWTPSPCHLHFVASQVPREVSPCPPWRELSSGCPVVLAGGFPGQVPGSLSCSGRVGCPPPPSPAAAGRLVQKARHKQVG